MSLTEKEVAICNQSLSRIGAKGKITYADQTGIEAEKCILHYEQTRNALQRSFEWNFASARSELVLLQTLTLDTAPMSDSWTAGTVLTGTSSNTTATIYSVTSDIEYKIKELDGDFTDGEKITDATISTVQWDGKPVYYGDDIVLSFDNGNELVCASGYPVVANSIPDFEWDYQFALPSDYSRMRSNYSESAGDEPEMRWCIEGDLLLTNDDEAQIRYIKIVTDPDEFDDLFKEVLVLLLAKKLINTLAGTNTTSLKEDINKDLDKALSKARNVCRQENNTSGYSGWTNARYGSGLE